jgi:ABC-type transport system involved in multi-copper enzyme maturation permease subunit
MLTLPNMGSLLGRLAGAIIHAAAAFLIAGIASCVALNLAVSNSHDGQAGMAAGLTGFYASCLAAIITFVVSLVRSSPSRRAGKSAS